MQQMLVLLGLLGTVAVGAYAQDARRKPVDLEIYADRHDWLADGTATLSGNIVVLVNGIHIAADYGTFSPNWKQFDFAGGAVRITPGAKIGNIRMRFGPQHPRPIPTLEVTPAARLPIP